MAIIGIDLGASNSTAAGGAAHVPSSSPAPRASASAARRFPARLRSPRTARRANPHGAESFLPTGE